MRSEPINIRSVFFGAIQMKEEELEVIGAYVKNHIADWIKESNIIPFSSSTREQYNLTERDYSLSERIVRVEEGIKHQGDLLEKMLDQMDKRFEQVDKRFEQIDTRFNDMSKRFSQLQWTIGLGFTVIATLMGIFNFY